ncbi:Chemotaxis response regulator protein-glutamate methylesterase [Rubripirellula lacrimiformis]|uniref:Protein-glutamate methylesterase/protein-glutamine glutaminase n=1 Tax=Rubripirellula lacrimiformis TaxID=1930273 RepID=A0A517NII8_9BACT|nr:chemotaxis response regulator protein-glutamate methylesterase [Rubripirellula lacrimiformis]QDT06942.1 Chemotaxis response regulator protein-glutamate methylesterase [Rubripirellula lacrimiformis]
MSEARKIRVLIVDDSTVIRRLLTQVLADDPNIEVVGTAPNGRIALAKIPNLKPDVVTLDIEMPEMDGLQTLTELRKIDRKLPVIMFSTLTHRGAEGTLDALERGANDYVGKPANVGSVTEGIAKVRGEMVPKIKGLCSWFQDHLQLARATQRSAQASSGPEATGLGNALLDSCSSPTFRRTPKQRVDVIAIGVSTGGPNALAQVLPSLPADLPVPVVIVQHMPPVFTKHLADRLNTKCSVTVAEAKAGDSLQPGTVWIAPGDFHMTVKAVGASHRVVLDQSAPVNSCRPAVDVLFQSVASNFGPGTLACILTGMGSDGLQGCRDVAKAGGHIIAQDRETSVVWGMPAAVTNAGLAHQVLSLQRVGAELTKHAMHGRNKLTLVKSGA